MGGRLGWGEGRLGLVGGRGGRLGLVGVGVKGG